MTKEKLNPKKKIGFVLLGLVVCCWIAVPVLPFLDFPYKAVTITILLVTGEALFLMTIALFGKEYWGKIKKKLSQIFSFKKKKDDEILPPETNTDKTDNKE